MNAPRRLLLLTAFGLLACDPSTRGHDASAPAQRVSEISVRIDAPGGGAPAISVLAFRASVSGLDPAQVLGVVDPLVASPPESCEVRDVAAAARALRAQGGGIELEEMANVSLALDDGQTGHPAQQPWQLWMDGLRPAPRVYPQLASAVGGVVGEAGPVDLAILPQAITVSLPEGPQPVRVEVVGVPRLLDAKGAALTADSRFEPGNLVLTLNGPAHSFVEIRPFGASQALACPVRAGGRVEVPRELLDRVAPPSGRVPVSFEAVWRDSRLVTSPGGQTARVSLETRSSTVLDLRAGSAELPRPPSPTVP
jgi:hypothetical protein